MSQQVLPLPGDALPSVGLLQTMPGFFSTAFASGTYGLVYGSVPASAATAGHTMSPFGVFSADWPSVTGKTRYMMVRAQLFPNATAIGTVTVTFGLYPVSSVAGASNVVALTLGTVTSGSTVAFVTPAASTLAEGNSGSFAFPADGYYLLGVVTSAQTAANSRLLYSVQAFVKYA